jgi:membrane-bound serine protease (ClpP class)
MIKYIRSVIFALLFLFGAMATVVQADAPRITVLQAMGIINPVLVDYIKSGITESENNHSSVCIIELDTPGGLDDSMREIIQSILSSKVPVVVYVSPSGSRAASAGVFITMSAHIAAMSTNTAIGAAHPVAIDSSGNEEQMSEEMTQKVTNDAVAYIRGLAASRGRNVDWAEKAVRESVSITETEALQQNVIDIVAPSLDDLLVKLDGRTVTLNDGTTVVLDTKSKNISYYNMTLVEEFLYAISNPNLAYVLLSVGSLGIMAEIFHPGAIFPGVFGAICLILGFYSLGMMPVNWTGVLLIVLAFALFVAEFFTAGFGVLFSGGLVSFVLGSLILFKGGASLFVVDWWVIALVVILVGGFVIFAVFRIVGTYHRQATTGREDLKGKVVEVRQTIDPEGTVFYEGELWKAVSESGRIDTGEEVVITRVDGLKVIVTKKTKE